MGRTVPYTRSRPSMITGTLFSTSQMNCKARSGPTAVLCGYETDILTMYKGTKVACHDSQLELELTKSGIIMGGYKC
jgi:hypothetical protein